MNYGRGDILQLLFPRHDPNRGPKRRYALVLSTREYNTANSHGVLVAISSGIPDKPLPGIYVIRDWKGCGLDKESVVVPWLYTLEWTTVIEKTGELSPYEFRQAMHRLREVVQI